MLKCRFCPLKCWFWGLKSQFYCKIMRSRRPGTGPRNGNSRKVLAGVLAQVLAKMGVLAGVLAQVLAGRALWENRDKAACQHLCQHSGQHPHFCQHLCQHPRQHFSGIPFSGSCTRSPGSQAKSLKFQQKQRKTNSKTLGTLAREKLGT